MLKNILLFCLCLCSPLLFAQIIQKPVGCFAGTNGTNALVLIHSEVRGVLLIEKWADLEPTPGNFDFSLLNAKINTVTAAGLPYALAISGGAFGSPSWLVDSLNVSAHSFQYQGQNWTLPLWWDPVCDQRLSTLISELGQQYAADSMLSHIYITQMAVNGVEGHLNGVDISSFTADGFTPQKWIDAAVKTATDFALAFPNKPIVFEVHEIDQDTLVPAAIVNNLNANPLFCERFGLGLWWISGKTSYQTDLLHFIENFQGDKYAQIIGRSDQVQRFEDSTYASVFTQAKSLGVRYIEPWPYEFQHNTNDSLMLDFNSWADTHFVTTDTCSALNAEENGNLQSEIRLFPNPMQEVLHLEISAPYKNLNIDIMNSLGQIVATAKNTNKLNVNHLAQGAYFIILHLDDKVYRQKIIKTE